jgi:hypothetical protein
MLNVVRVTGQVEFVRQDTSCSLPYHTNWNERIPQDPKLPTHGMLAQGCRSTRQHHVASACVEATLHLEEGASARPVVGQVGHERITLGVLCKIVLVHV